MAEPTFDVFVQTVYKGSPEQRLALAQQLKNAGLYSGKVSANLDTKYYTALTKLEAAYQQQAAIDKITGATVTPGRYDILTNLMAEGADTGAGGVPKTTTQTYVTSPSQTAKLLDTVAEDLLGRKLTKEEKNKYTQLINAQQKKQPSVTTSGQGFSSTRGGIDEQQFVTEKIGATTEAKTNRATDAYSIMMQELGGLR
jgi:histidyl-tRNA synthetase